MLAVSLLPGASPLQRNKEWGSREGQLGTGQEPGPDTLPPPALTPSTPPPGLGGLQHPSPATTAWNIGGP